MSPKDFQTKILAWFNKHGRKNLPWQKKITPYRVWLSEIMLQQTQVQMVIPYFNKFLTIFPTIKKLAKADLDDILHLWSGLGYYARARNLHKTAQIIICQYSGKFPKTLDALQELPGIGKSTAGAILAISMKQRGIILDGNVKRVLARYAVTNGDLWSLAEQLTPTKNIAEYTQAMMDLGAIICTRTAPHCNTCPLKKSCQAHLTHCETLFPEKKLTKKIPTRKTHMLILRNHEHAILLEKRPPVGIWGGLWCLPQIMRKSEINELCLRKYGCKTISTKTMAPFRHTFSHFHLDIIPLIINIELTSNQMMEKNDIIWYNEKQIRKLGLPKPVKDLLDKTFERGM